MFARDATITVIDFETTGVVEGFAAEPWQYGIVQLRGGRVEPDSQFTGFMRVSKRPFSPYAPGTWLSHLDDIANAPTPANCWPLLQPQLDGDALAAHSIGTEKKILRELAPLHRMPSWVDTLKLARLAFPEWPSHTLEDVTTKLGLLPRITSLCPGREAHDALFDAVAAAVLLEHFLSLDGWRDATVEALASANPRAFHRRAK